MPNHKLKPSKALAKLDDKALQHVADYFKLLSEPTRLKILNILREGECNVGELCAQIGGSQANISKHLGQLAQAGLVERTTRGTAAYYVITDPSVYALCDLVCGQVAARLEKHAAMRAMFGDG